MLLKFEFGFGWMCFLRKVEAFCKRLTCKRTNPKITKTNWVDLGGLRKSVVHQLFGLRNMVIRNRGHAVHVTTMILSEC